MSAGKRFEEDFIESFQGFETRVSIDRLKDPMSGRAGVRNICDYIIYRTPYQYYVELKSYEGLSISFDAVTDTQRDGLTEKSQKLGVFAGVLLNYRGPDRTFWIDIFDFHKLRNEANRKSIHIDQAKQVGIYLQGTKKRTRYGYDVMRLLEDIRERGRRG